MVSASVIVATYNRTESLERLLMMLAKQYLPREDFEVVVVDDGSKEEVGPVVAPFEAVLQLTVLRQRNSGVAIARQRGVEAARGRIVIFLDDDMRVAPDFVAQHILAHGQADDRVVMGELLPDDRLAEMPLFERFHAHQLTKLADRYAAAGTFSGKDVYTGNLSLPRALFFRAGGFDPAFHIEDVELGVRLENAGARFVFSRAAASTHASDHTALETWLDRSVRDGRDWVRLVRKHPQAHGANPWRFLEQASALARPVFVSALVAPTAAPVLSRLILRAATSADALGLDRLTVRAMTVVYGIQYFTGVRDETGSIRDMVESYRSYRQTARA